LNRLVVFGMAVHHMQAFDHDPRRIAVTHVTLRRGLRSVSPVFLRTSVDYSFHEIVIRLPRPDVIRGMLACKTGGSMARIARFSVSGLPHHVTQRGNRRERVFFGDDDYELYRNLLASQCRQQGVACWAYCLLPNHVHLILVPDREEALGETHRRYSSVVNARLRVTGHLFQSRFGSVVMDEEHLVAAARYVALNPVRAGLAGRAEDWRWSSAKAHLEGRDDGLVSVGPLLERCGGRFADLLDAPPSAGTLSALRAAETIGRPLGSAAFLDFLAAATGRDPRPKRRGPKPRVELLGVEESVTVMHVMQTGVVSR
jgi:putative transposase